MIIFCACSGLMVGAYPHLQERVLKPERKFNELRSYAEMPWFTGTRYPKWGQLYFLDSGAFSAFSRGFPVELQRYGEFIQRYKASFDYYANLDAIPQNNDFAAAAQETLENQLRLEEMGLSPIPVYHKGEPEEYLVRYLEKYDYICLGGLVSDSTLSNEDFFEYVWGKYLANPDGTPKRKIHAFGMTSLKSMVAYPWYSVDSSTWLIHSKHGQIAVPVKRSGKYDYTVKPYLIAVSDRSSAKQWMGWHIDTLPEEHRDEILGYLKEKDIDVEKLRGYPDWRFAANLEYWIDLQNYGTFCTKYVKKQHELL